MMKIEVTSVSTSKKGTCWIQAKLIEGTIRPSVDEFYDCKYDQETTRRGGKQQEEKKDEQTEN